MRPNPLIRLLMDHGRPLAKDWNFRFYNLVAVKGEGPTLNFRI